MSDENLSQPGTSTDTTYQQSQSQGLAHTNQTLHTLLQDTQSSIDQSLTLLR